MPSSAPANDHRRPLSGGDRPRPATHKLLGPVHPDEIIGVSLVVRLPPGRPPLPDFDHWQRTPLADRKYLTPEEYVHAYGAEEEDLAAVTVFANAHGLTVTESHAGRRTVSVHGTAAQMASAFGVTLNYYETPIPTAPRARTRGECTEPRNPVRTTERRRRVARSGKGVPAK